ncbi:MAG: pyrroline-5-carboxylate reductase [Clostridiales bacterium]|nr:pyrroline-5-carboxylate reductase [Clostridiales bacterium]
MKIGFIGTGNMGGAILRGYVNSGKSGGNSLYICNRTRERSDRIVSELSGPVTVCQDARELVRACDIVIIGVKPQGMEELLKEIAPEVSEGKVFVSMAAGVSIAAIKKYLGEKTGIIRIMPNTPAMVGKAMTSLSPCEYVSESELEAVKVIFDSIGRAEVVPEHMIDCVIGVSGSSPAYTYMYIDALAKAAEARGMEAEAARIFAAQSVLGAAEMVLQSSESPEQLRINVCSPGGTTIEAVNSLIDNDFEKIVREAFEAAVNRSIEMTGGTKK